MRVGIATDHGGFWLKQIALWGPPLPGQSRFTGSL